MNLSFIFPGQGSQKIGMGKELFSSFGVAKEVFQEVDDSLNENLSKLIFEGPLEDLTLTFNAQPAIMTVSIAALKVLESFIDKNIDLMISEINIENRKIVLSYVPFQTPKEDNNLDEDSK